MELIIKTVLTIYAGGVMGTAMLFYNGRLKLFDRRGEEEVEVTDSKLLLICCLIFPKIFYGMYKNRRREEK